MRMKGSNTPLAVCESSMILSSGRPGSITSPAPRTIIAA